MKVTQYATYLKIVLVLAKLRMAPRTMPIPLSSEAFNCNRRYARLLRIIFYPRMQLGINGQTLYRVHVLCCLNEEICLCLHLCNALFCLFITNTD